MATVSNSIHGGITGKVGHAVGYQLNGKWIIRSLPSPSKKNKKGTEKQKACRNSFTKMQSFLRPIIPFVRIGFNMKSKKRMMTAHNVAKSYNMLNAQNLDGEIDYSKVCLTYGKIIGPEDPNVSIDDSGIRFCWSNPVDIDHERKFDQVMLMAYDVENEIAFYETSGAKRLKGLETIEIPAGLKGSTYHTWISFISDDRESISMSTYCGSIVY